MAGDQVAASFPAMDLDADKLPLPKNLTFYEDGWRNSSMKLRRRISRWLIEHALSSVKVCRLKGLEVACLLDDDAAFESLVEQCLLLVESSDPRRYKRIKRHLKWILGSREVARNCGRYMSIARACVLNPDPDRNDDCFVAHQAGVIVHEATHGFLSDRGFKYDQDTRVQIERICCAEENRFLSRLPPAHRDKLCFEFDPGHWAESWYTPKWRRMLRELRRVFWN